MTVDAGYTHRRTGYAKKPQLSSAADDATLYSHEIDSLLANAQARTDMKAARPFIALIAVLTWTLTTACTSTQGPLQTYDGPPRNSTEVALLTVPRALDVLRVDGHALELPFGLDDPYRLQLLPGPRSIEFVYLENWGPSRADKIVASDVVAISSNFAAGDIYTLEFDQPASETQAEQLASGGLEAWIVDPKTGETVRSRHVRAYRSRLSQALFGPAEPAYIAPSTPPSPPIAAATSGIAATDGEVSPVLRQLKDLWRKAGADERSEFLNWIVQPAQ